MGPIAPEEGGGHHHARDIFPRRPRSAGLSQEFLRVPSSATSQCIKGNNGHALGCLPTTTNSFRHPSLTMLAKISWPAPSSATIEA
jgi:hypothetical protein